MRRLGRRLGLTLGHRLLHRDRAGDRSTTLANSTIAPSPISLTIRPLCSASSGSIACSRRPLIAASVPASSCSIRPRVADDVGGQDRRQPALDARGGGRALRRRHLGGEQVAALGHGLEQLLRLVAQRLADVADALGDRFVADHHIRPDRGHDRVAVHDPARVLDQQPQQRQRLRPQRHLRPVRPEQSAAGEVEGEAVEAPGRPLPVRRPSAIPPRIAAVTLENPRI